MAIRKKTNFIKKHEYPGGKKALIEFINSHLVYPALALKNNKEGSVLMEYQIGFDGDVKNAKVLHGIGDGCDEEAIRLVQLLKFAPQNNHGIKVITTQKIKINFRLPSEKKAMASTKITYNITVKKSGKTNEVQPKSKTNYSYTIVTKPIN